jgi:CheY-like chemotaxis protein
MHPAAIPGGCLDLPAHGLPDATGGPFELVLIDAGLPEIDGRTLAQRMAETPHWARSKIILLTAPGHTPAADPVLHRRAVAGTVVKPIHECDLIRTMAACVGDRKPEKQRRTGTAAGSPKPGRSYRILLAEDNLLNQRLAARIIEREGHTVTIAGNGQEAVEAAQRETFDVILMDVQMPVVDGLQATAAIRERERLSGRTRPTPIVAMTAHAMKGDRERCLVAGMNAYVAKPFKPADLTAAIESLLSTAQDG